MADTGVVSPLAPKGGFPKLPVIDGIRFSSVEAGVRYKGRPDVMLAEIAPGASIAGVFTRSETRAAPVLWCEDILASTPDPSKGYAIIVNSGNANAFTGRNGREGVEATTKSVADTLDIPRTHVFVSSTGVIGEPLKSDRITAKLTDLKNGLDATKIGDAAAAIRTTDTYSKGATANATISGTQVQIAGIAKGSGMIAPDMATMLVYIFTDAAIERECLQSMLSSLTRVTFNAITVDGDTSTSDTLLLTATGAAQNTPITNADSAEAQAFSRALHSVMLDLAHQVVRDGEGATKFVEIRVSGADTNQAAHSVGMAIANSPLVKTAIAGEDPNWGRVVMAVGKAGEKADRDKLSIRFGDILVAENGWVSPDYREEDGAAYMKAQDLTISVDLGVSDGAATVWTCDLTHQYIYINADYRS